MICKQASWCLSWPDCKAYVLIATVLRCIVCNIIIVIHEGQFVQWRNDLGDAIRRTQILCQVFKPQGESFSSVCPNGPNIIKFPYWVLKSCMGRLHESTAFICYYNLIDYILSFLGQCYRTLDKSENIKEPAGGIEFW